MDSVFSMRLVSTRAVCAVTLPAGNYWIAVAVQASTQFAQGSSGSVRYNVSWSPWDKTFPAGTLTTAPDTLSRVNLYVVGKP